MIDPCATTNIMKSKKLSKWKVWGVKFGIICGMVTGGCSSFNAVLGTVQEWNKTFNSEERVQEEVESSESVSEASENLIPTWTWYVFAVGSGVLVWSLLKKKKD